MIKVINPSRLTRQPFFHELINYLDQHDDVTLREIKREFANFPNIDRSIEDYIKAGYVLRENKRYHQSVPLLENVTALSLDQEVFVRDDSPLYQELLNMRFETHLTNQTNQAILVEKTDFLREQLTLSNYFYRLKQQYPLINQQQKLYDLVGDVNPEYALKYMTTFLLKYGRKTELMQKRRDIFVDALVILGYIVPNEARKYELKLDFDKETLTFRVKEALDKL
ncbi:MULTISPECIES: DUF1803 domain-containing protein [Streptococcus]|mgnify:FL=1|uniref:DUF1803 domain-containing protein n=1 Tax=Streptococcus TaxID=1301 RepID=UPI0018A047A4|nr:MULTISPECIES: DUF1803 domain-containing protein [Streptococcus]MBF7076369.1 DUF1803 domain-containing protein [Streptococcus sp. HF-100]MCW1052724.1 DUF1803 domain-containing protein [Streptococcus anginosus]